MGSTPSKHKQSPRYTPPPPPRSIIRGPRREPVPGYPATYDGFQEQMFTTNNFAPYRTRQTVNFRDDLVVRSPASRPIRNVEPIQVASVQSNEVLQETDQQEQRLRVDALSPPSNMPRQPAARPPRDWNELWMDENEMMPYSNRYRDYDAPFYPYYTPMRGYECDPYGRCRVRQDPYHSGFIYDHYMPNRRNNFFGPPYYPNMRRRPFPNISDYRQAYVPQQRPQQPPPQQQQQQQQPQQQQQQQQQPQQPQVQYQTPVLQQYAQGPQTGPIRQQPVVVSQAAVPRVVQQYGSAQSQNTYDYIQPIQVNSPKSKPTYEIEDVPAPMYDDGYERVSLLSNVSKNNGENNNETEYITPVTRKSSPTKLQVVMMDDDDDYIGSNLRFYRNEIRYRPDGEYIDKIHNSWVCRYEKLANTSTYMAWLFPLTKRSRVNPFAEPLKKHEARHIFNDDEARERYITSYKMMLDFFGLELVSEKTGEVKRSRNWKDRFQHLRRSKRSHERITRILQSLGLLGYPHFQAPLVLRLFHETVETKELSSIPFPALKVWHRSIDNVYDSNYVTDEFTKMAQRQKLTIIELKDTDDKRDSKQPLMIKDTSKAETNDQLYRFQSKRDDSARISDHDSKDERLTYRDDDEDDDDDKLVTTSRNAFAPATPSDGEPEDTSSRQPYQTQQDETNDPLLPPYSETDPYK